MATPFSGQGHGRTENWRPRRGAGQVVVVVASWSGQSRSKVSIDGVVVVGGGGVLDGDDSDDNESSMATKAFALDSRIVLFDAISA